ncbi:hypothetical protein AQUCO_05400035v1, partial [Aquilegia coerulea]
DNPPQIPIPKFPISSVSNFDVWINGPLSIQARRKRLLQEMGLSNDPLLSRNNHDFDIGRSASDDHLCRRQPHIDIGIDSDCFIVRSKSDGSVTTTTTSDHCNHSSISSSIHSVESVSKNVSFLDDNSNVYVSSNGSSTAATNNSNKPPTGRNLRRMERIRPFWTNLNPNCNKDLRDSSLVRVDGNGEECAVNSDCIGGGNHSDMFCKIKNLDNGKEFVVNEVREDGMWNKVREIDTGHQLTAEEFESCVGHSPIVQELMRRQNVENLEAKKDEFEVNENGGTGGGDNGSKSKKKVSWLKTIKNVASAVTGHWEKRNSVEWDSSSDKVGRRSSSGTEDGQNTSFHCPEKVRVRQYGKSWKELTALYKNQKIQAHNGSIWSIKFSLDGQYLASAGEDCVIHVWQVIESDKRGEFLVEKSDDGSLNPFFLVNGSPELTLVPSLADTHLEKKRRSKVSISRKSVNLGHVVMPDSVFALSETPICSFRGHLDDVLDLSWSKSQYLLSSSMDKTVRLWHMDSHACLKIFSHSDYVTCIQFNPIDDRYFISGSLDAKVRIWSIPDRQVVDWNDLHEMVTAASYTPDGQGALVGSYKGSCRLFNTSENKLQQKSQIDLQNKRKKSHLKKITGFQFAPGRFSEVLITSADSRIRVVESTDLVHKFKGFRNANSQMSASLTANGKYVVCASEDSCVYVWKHESNSRPGRNKGVTVTRSHEHFHCQDVSVAIPWPVLDVTTGTGEQNRLMDDMSGVEHFSPQAESDQHRTSPLLYGSTNGTQHDTVSNVNNSYFFDRFSVTWPEEKLPVAGRNQIARSFDLSNGMTQDRAALGMVIVTASLKGEIRVFQNFGLPVHV